jgi:2-polyprenyl-3-methyl-5-hydroxy-6-metoxy-1,4-benzoquinol methylase
MRLIAGFETAVAGLVRIARGMQPFGARARANPKFLGPPVVRWPNPSTTRFCARTCPNCGRDDPKPLLLTVEFTTSPGSRRNAEVVRCPACGCPFYMAQIPPDYAEDAMLEWGRVPFYLQQGAGLSLITRPLAQVRAPAGSTYAEVGCGFGFGLDYAHHAKQWTGRGIDPGGIAQLGQQMLGVTIERRYLGDNEPELTGSCDVIMASETIEHVLSPSRFVHVLRAMLRPGGTLILTTPDGADLNRDTPPNILIGLLSPGLHLIFQTRESLLALLTNAGFAHVVVAKDGHSLVAFASDRPVELETDGTALRREYRDYLERRAANFDPADDMFLAFAGRLLQEAANDGTWDQAQRGRTMIERACEMRFGAGLEALGAQVPGISGVSLEELAKRIPLALGGLLFADAMVRLATGTSRSKLRDHFLRAAEACELLTAALADLALADGMSEEIAWVSRAEAALCAAASGAHDAITALDFLPAAPDAVSGKVRRDVIAERALVELVNAGHYSLATQLCKTLNLDAKPWTDPAVDTSRSISQRDALFSLAILGLQQDDVRIIARSRDRFALVARMVERSGSTTSDGLVAASRGGEVDALERLGDHEAASALRAMLSPQAGG